MTDISFKRRCYKCKVTKNSDEFYGNRSNKTGINTSCIECDRAYAQEKYRKYNGKYVKNWYDNNRKTIALKRQALRQQRRLEIINHLGGSCKKCGFTDIRALQVDHVNGGGNKERRLSIASYYRRIMEDETGKYQLLCANCNWIKKIDNKEYGGRGDKVLHG